MGPSRRSVWTALKIAVAAALLALVLWQVDWPGFAALLARLEPGWLLAGVALTALDRLFMAAKWAYLLRGLGVPVRLGEALAQYLFGSFVSLATQWQLSGDLARAAGLARRLGQGQKVAASVIVEKLAGFAAVSLLSLGSLALLVARYDLGEWRPAVVAAVLLAAAASGLPFLALARRVRSPLARAAGRLPGEPVRRLAAKLFAAMDELDGLGRVAAPFLAMTVAEQLVPLANLWLFARAFDVGLGVVPIAATMPIIQLFSRLPISIEAVGVREGLYLVLLGFVGLSTAESFAISLVGRVVNTLVYGLGGLAALGLRRPVAAPGEAAP